jgi:hypothetical protein
LQHQAAAASGGLNFEAVLHWGQWAVPISSHMSLVTADKPRSSPRARSVTLQSVAAILSASLLGIGLAYCACTMLIPAVAQERSAAQDVICSNDTSSTSPQKVRADE